MSAVATEVATLERLAEIKDEMLELLREAETLLRPTPEYERARSYWIPHIRMALDDEHSWLGGSMCTLQDTIDELAECEYGDEDDVPPTGGAMP